MNSKKKCNLLVKKGDHLLSSRKYREAVEKFTEAIDMAPRKSLLGELHTKRGLCLYRLKLFEDSINEYEMALKYEQEDDVALYGAGVSCYNLVRFEESISYFEKSLKINNRNDASLSGLGNVYRECGEYMKAIENYDAAIKINRNNFHAFQGKGTTLFLMKKYHASLEVLSQCLQMNSRFQPVYITIGNVYKAISKFEDAVTFYSKAIEIDVENSIPFYCRSICYEKLGLHEKSINDLKIALTC